VAGLPDDTSIKKRIELDSWRLAAIPDDETEMSANLARHMYKTYKRGDYASDEKYGRSLHEMVQAFAKTNNIDLAYDIVQNLRESVYHEPSIYLDYVIDLCLMEIYIETFDYKRALNLEIEMVNNQEYHSLPVFQSRKENLLNEIAFLNNRLGNGSDALKYLDLAKAEYESKDLQQKDLEKKIATNQGNRGRAYLLIGKYEEAEAMGKEVLKAGKKRKDSYMTTLAYRLMGSAHYNMGNYEEAEKNLKKGIALADEKKIATMQKFLYADYALNSEGMGHYKEALLWTRKQKTLEIKAQEAAAEARISLNAAEDRARNSHKEVLGLKKQSKTLRIIIASLLVIAFIFAVLLSFLSKIQKNLIRSEKEAQAANKAKSEFLANMSHEIRTPMNGVLGMLEVLRQTELNETQFHYTNIINQSGNLLLGVISDILDLSKIEAGKLSLDMQPCNLNELTKNIVELHGANAKEKNLSLNLIYSSNIPDNYITDGQRIGQILNNLVGNAIKFTDSGSVTVKIDGKIESGMANIRFDVTDTGIGISEDKISLIFDKFSQAESSTTRKYGGTGLGLTISRRLAEAMQGHLHVWSELGQGTTFSVKLPLEIADTKKVETTNSKIFNAPKLKLKADHTQTITPPAHQKPAQKPAKNIAQAKKIVRSKKPVKIEPPQKNYDFLIIEEDPLSRAVATTLLKHPQVRIQYSETGRNAVQACEKTKFDLIFISTTLRDTSSAEVLNALRHCQKGLNQKHTPIIGLVEDREMEDGVKHLNSGMDDYLSKPLNRGALRKVLSKYLSHMKPIETKQASIMEPTPPLVTLPQSQVA